MHQLRVVAGRAQPAGNLCGSQDSGNEVPLVDSGDTLRIDRLVQVAADGCWWVLDYKLSSAPQQLAANRLQMRRYRAAVQALQPNDEVRAAFITAQGLLIEVKSDDVSLDGAPGHSELGS